MYVVEGHACVCACMHVRCYNLCVRDCSTSRCNCVFERLHNAVMASLLCLCASSYCCMCLCSACSKIIECRRHGRASMIIAFHLSAQSTKVLPLVWFSVMYEAQHLYVPSPSGIIRASATINGKVDLLDPPMCELKDSSESLQCSPLPLPFPIPACYLYKLQVHMAPLCCFFL